MPYHAQVPVSVGGQSADIDVALVPVIEALWERGIVPVGSCEDMGAYRIPALVRFAMIGFADQHDARRFARTVRRRDRDPDVKVLEPLNAEERAQAESEG